MSNRRRWLAVVACTVLVWGCGRQVPPPGQDDVAIGDRLRAEGRDTESTAAYRKAAEAGHPSGQLMLGAAYFDGRGVARDKAQAARWFRNAAEQGNPRAQHHLAFMLEGDEKRTWMLRSADAGYAPAQHAVALILLSEENPASDRRAYKHLLSAAESGDAQAQGVLGLIYADGRGTLQNFQKAYQWLSLASSRATDRSEFASARDRARREISSSQAEEAYRAADAWLTAHERHQAEQATANRWWPIPWLSKPKP